MLWEEIRGIPDDEFELLFDDIIAVDRDMFGCCVRASAPSQLDVLGWRGHDCRGRIFAS